MTKRRERAASLPKGVYERPAGSGVYWARWYDGEGREHNKRVGTAPAAAKFVERQRATRTRQRLFPEPATVPFLADALDDTLARTAGECTPGTHREYVRAAAFFKLLWGKRRLTELRAGDVERWRRDFLATKRTPATANRYLAVLKRAYNDAARDGTLTRDHALSRVMPLKENNKRTRWLSDEEWPALLRALPDDARLPVIFAAYTGLRQGEQFRMRWEDVDMQRAVLTIPLTKRGEARTIPLNATALGVLMEQRRRAGTSEFVWPSATQLTPLNAMNFCRRHFRPALAAAGIRNFRWHDLRHTFASLLTVAGVAPIALRDLLGHSTLEMTARYAHLRPTHLSDAVRLLDRERKLPIPPTPTRAPRTLQ